MTDEALARCENLSCLCTAPSGETACSPYCASPDGRDITNLRCSCGHDICTKTIEEQLHGGSGRESA